MTTSDKRGPRRALYFMDEYDFYPKPKEANMRQDLNALAIEIHAHCVKVGWWDAWPNRMDRHRTSTTLIITELAEAVEGDRKSLMDDHLPKYEMYQVEIADAAIRTLDFSGAMVNMGEIIFARPERHLQTSRSFADAHFVNTTFPEEIYIVCRCLMDIDPVIGMDRTLIALTAMAIKYDFDLWQIVKEKRAYNAKRADHKRENRAKAGGKAY